MLEMIQQIEPKIKDGFKSAEAIEIRTRIKNKAAEFKIQPARMQAHLDFSLHVTIILNKAPWTSRRKSLFSGISSTDN